MTDAPKKIWAWIDLSPAAYERGEVEGEWSGSKFSEEGDEVSYTRTDLADANERAAYLRGLEDAGAAVRNACNCDSALDAIRALAEQVRNETD